MSALEEDLDVDMLDFGSPALYQEDVPYVPTKANLKVLDYVNATFGSITEALDVKRPPFGEVCVVLKRVAKQRNNQSQPHSSRASRCDSEDMLDPKPRSRQVRYCWPGNTPKEAWRFASLVTLFGEIKTAITNGTIVTKRDIFYRDPELFQKQGAVDRWVDDIAFTCGVSRKDLMVTASPKGLICGFDTVEGVQSIPPEFDNISAEDLSHLRWILVVEKEASFNTLVESHLHQSAALGHGLLVTAKGYPDLHTRLLLRYLLDTSMSFSTPLPIYGLFDGDPDGLEIYRCYHSDPRGPAQESACNLPEMLWLGVDLCELLGDRPKMAQTVSMTARDRGRARSMLTRIADDDMSGQGVNMRQMLQTMLMLGKKMEIQALDTTDDGAGICGWLEHKMMLNAS